MNRSFQDLNTQALKVRDHYAELQKANGQKVWDAKDRMAGFVGDVGMLSKLIMAKYDLRKVNGDVDEQLEHEISDCLWSVMVIADELGIDLEKSFSETMKGLHERIEKEKSGNA